MGKLYYLGNSRSKEQTDEMIRLEHAVICLFCPEGLKRRKKLLVSRYWIVVRNDYPYSGTLSHVMALSKRHVEDMADLIPDELADLSVVLTWHRDAYRPKGYGIAVRNKNPAYTGGTIGHLHIHLITGDPSLANTSPVRFRLSSSP